MKKQTRITLIAIITILMLLVIGGTIYGYVQKYAFADYIDVATDPNAIVNFNQLIAPSYNSPFSIYNGVITGSVSANSTYNIANIGRLSPNHKYYLYFSKGVSFSSIQITNNMNYSLTGSINWVSGSYDHIFTSASNSNYYNYDFYLSTETSGTTFQISIYMIDLTLMYNSGSEPDINQCRELFLSDYYNYNSGTAMPANGFTLYNNGYQDAYNAIQANLTYSIVASDVYNNATNFDLGNYCGQPEKATDPNIYYIYTNPNPTFNDSAQYPNGFYMPFNTTISGGAILKLQGCIATYMGFAEQLQPIYCAVVTQGQIRNLYTFDQYLVGSGDVGNLLKASYDLTLTMPYDCNGLYFYSLEQFACANLSVMVQNFDLQTAIASARQQAQSQAEEYYTNLYSQGGERYEQIFNAGKQYALTHNANNAWGSAWDFIESAFTGIGGIFAVQLLPGVPLSVFILVPLMISLIFFIVKLTKGGGD